MPPTNPKFCLALTGGGYYARAFRLGTVRKLYKMELQKRVYVLSTTSGDFVTGACYCTRECDYPQFYDQLYVGLHTKNVIREVIFSWFELHFLFFIALCLGAFYFLFTPYTWVFTLAIMLLLLVILKFQFRIFPVSKRITKIYDSFFYQKEIHGEFRVGLLLVKGAINQLKGRFFIFFSNRSQKPTYECIHNPFRLRPEKLMLECAIMPCSYASSSFCPVTMKKSMLI